MGIRTTIPAKDGSRASDLLNRDFTAAIPSRSWVMDFTYVRAWSGWVYLTFVVDVFAQRVMAWHAASTKDVDLVMTPIRMATWEREREGHPGVHGQLSGHADAGSQYAAVKVTEHLDLEGIRPSIGTVADAFDNALMECVIGLYKTRCVRTTVFHDGHYRSVHDVEYATAGWVDWYNQRQLHSGLGYHSPAEFEHARHAALNREPEPVEERPRTWGVSAVIHRGRDGSRS